MEKEVEVLELEETTNVPLKKETKKESLLVMNIKVLIKKVIFIVLLIYIMFFYIFGFVRIKNNAMTPNIAAGDLLLYYRLDKKYNVGDVVTFNLNNRNYILRVIAVEGDIVSKGSNGDFLINGDIEYHKTYLENSFPSFNRVKYPYKVPKGKVFVVGDYRSEYNDSRVFGAISTDTIKGKVIGLIQTKDI